MEEKTKFEALAKAFTALSREEMAEFVECIISNDWENGPNDDIEENLEQVLLTWSLEVLDDEREI